MKEFLLETALPFLGVCAAVSGLTATVFDVPSSPPRRAAAPIAAPMDEPSPSARREQVSEVLSRAMRNLNAGRMPRPDAPAAPPAAPVTEAPAKTGAAPPAAAALPATAPSLPTPMPPDPAPTDPSLLAAVAALGDAVKTVHEVRTEEDLVQAEGRMRAARERMEAACKNGAGPLCEGAEQMKQLGY